jgi:4'-phosphopantetheinyl transferase
MRVCASPSIATAICCATPTQIRSQSSMRFSLPPTHKTAWRSSTISSSPHSTRAMSRIASAGWSSPTTNARLPEERPRRAVLNEQRDRRYITPQMRLISDIPAVPRPGVVDVWRVPLHGDEAQFAFQLSESEQERLARRSGVARRRFAISHAAMRQIVAAYQGCAPAFAILSTPYGEAPRAAGGIELSLSHCEDLALVAVACTPVGVDIEALTNVADDLDELAEFALSEAEIGTFRAAPARRRPGTLLRAWTRKEACLKARGEGVGDRALAELDVSRNLLGELTIIDVDAGPEHMAAVAVAHAPARLAWKEWRDDTQ